MVPCTMTVHAGSILSADHMPVIVGTKKQEPKHKLNRGSFQELHAELLVRAT